MQNWLINIIFAGETKLLMKIFYIYTALVTKGGADRVITEKANWLSEHGHEVAIVTDTQMGRPPVFPLSPNVRLIDLSIDFSKEYGHIFFLRTIIYFKLMRIYHRKMKDLLMIERPDIVISTLGRDIAFITKINDGSMKIGEAHTTKHFIRNFHLLESKNIFFRCLTKYFRWRMDKQVGRLDALIVLTQQHADDWKGLVPISVIPNALSFYPKQASSCEKKQVIAIGRYNDAKGYDYLISAWNIVHQRHQDWVLNVYGSGEYYEQVVLWIKEQNLEKAIILHEPTTYIVEKYQESSICVLSSRYEGFPMVLLEAMGCGVPVVSFDCPHGPRAIINDGEDGYLVDYLNVQALADGICKLIEDKELRKEMGRKGRLNVLRFSRDAVMQQWVNLFESLTKGKES